MEENTPSARASKSAHVIDLRQAGARRPASSAPARPKSKPVKPGRAAKKASAAVAPARKAPAPAPAAPTYTQAATPGANPAPAAPRTPVAAVTRTPDAVSDDFFDAPPARRRFWPAFWRFLLLLVVLGLLICGGVYLYLKFYNP